MKKALFALMLLLSIKTQAQVGIGTPTPDVSAQLDVSSTSKGFLPPRMTFAQRKNITNPSAGLIVWCTDCGQTGEMQVYDGSLWKGVSLVAATEPPPPPVTGNSIVISQVYGGGGNAGPPVAIYNRDYVEIYNPTSSSVSLEGWTIQYTSASGTIWSKTANLTGSIGAGKYYLAQMTTGGTNGSALPIPDYTNQVNIDLAGANGKVALVNNSTLLSGSCPTDASIIDFVGYGSANCSEGGSAALAGSNILSITRKNNGCKDSNNNLNDFESIAPAPRNSSTPAFICP